MMKDANSCHSWLFKYVIVAALAILVAGCAGTPPEEPPVADPFEVVDDEAENDVPMDGSPIEFDDTYKPPSTGIPGLKGKKFRAVTYNLHLWGKLKDKPQGKKTVLVKKAGVAQPMSSAIFSLFSTWGADVIALQEVYSKTPPIPLTSQAGYTVLPGNKIFNNEYCPIVFRNSKMDCKSLGVSPAPAGKRKTHWAECTLKPKPPITVFYFGCTHFATKSQDIQNNLADLLNRLSTGTKPSGAATSNDTYILGLDANSSKKEHLRSAWRRAHNKYKDGEKLGTKPGTTIKQPKGAAISFETITPTSAAGGFTKIYKRKKGGKPVIKVTGDVSKRVIDELIWRLTRDITYIPDSKNIIPVTDLNLTKPGNKPALDWPAFWVEYYKLSDHLPVKADFSY